MAEHRPIFLIGYMACGKTTLGSALRRAAQTSLVDLDLAIEEQEGMPVREIFATRGEAEFRKIEAEMLRSYAGFSYKHTQLIACGGGTPCHGDNMDLMLRSGTVVWLKADRETTLRRIRLAGDSRPLLAGKTDEELARFVDESYELRRPFYESAHFVFDSSHLETEEEIAQSVALFIKQFNLKWQHENFM